MTLKLPRKMSFVIMAVLLSVWFASSSLAEQLPLKTYSSTEGLASSVIHHIARDSKGFLWFCARGGLSRFDGTEFTSYQIGDENSPIVQSFFETRDGTYWVSTDKALYRVTIQENADVQPVSVQQTGDIRPLNAKKVAETSFFALYEDQQGRFWGAGNFGLYAIEDRTADRVTLRAIDFSPFFNKDRRNAVRGLTEAADGSFWLVATAGAARLLPDGRWVEYRLPRITKYESAYALRLAKDGCVWISHNTGVFVFQPEPLSAFETGEDRFIREWPIVEGNVGIVGKLELPTASGKLLRLKFTDENETNNAGQAVDSAIQDIYPSADGRLWIPSSKNLYVFDGENYRRLKDTKSLPGRSARIVEDLEGNLWFGTFGGVVKYVRNGLITYDQAAGLEESTVHSIQETADGNLFVSHGTWRISLLKPEGLTDVKLNLPAENRFIWTAKPVFLDKKGDVWALTDNGLFRFPASSSITDYERQTPHNEIPNSTLSKEDFWYRAFPDSRGYVWFATRNVPERNFLLRLNLQTGEWMDFTNAEGFPKGKPVASMAEDKAGNLWFGFYGTDGLVRFSDGRFRHFTPDEGLPRGAALDLLVDGHGRLWIASVESGVTRVNDPTADKLEFVRYSEFEGLSNNNVRCLTVDANGQIYAGTVRGVSRIDPETGRIRRITTADGLAADFVHTAFRDSRGTVWFGTAGGLSKLEPKIEPPPAAPQIFISDLTIAGTVYNVSQFGQKTIENIEVSAGQNNLQVRFFGLGESNALRYQYKLVGAEQEDWSQPSEQRSINFGNLSSGTYRLLIRAINESGAVGEIPAVIGFRINPPFWRTWWFLSLAFLLLAGAVFALDRYRVAKTRQVETALKASQASETRFRTLADTASDAILTIDEESRIIFANQAIEKVFGYTVKELIGQKMTILMPERMRGGHDAGIERYLRTSKKNINWEGVALPGLHKDGQEIPLEVSFGEFERDGRRFFTGIARDVSERRRAEEALQKAREERIAELQRVRSRIATDLHDDIGSSLTQISLYSELARRHEAETGKAGEPLNLITNVANELVETMSDIVWAINPKKDHLQDLTQRMRRFAANVLSAKNIEMEFSAPVSDYETPLGANIRREVFLIFKETVNNIVKHSQASKAKIDFRREREFLEIIFEDDGQGFEQNGRSDMQEDWRKFRGGNGLLNMKRRAEDLGGSYEIRSAIGKGTTVILSIPIEPA